MIGILCGQCKEGGVSVLLNKCVSCSDYYLALIGVLGKIILRHSDLFKRQIEVVLDILTMFLIVMFGFSLPQWIYPFLFYIQVSLILQKIIEYFQMASVAAFSFPFSFIDEGKYVSSARYIKLLFLSQLYYLSSGFGFYFVYDFCLSASVSTVLSYLLKFVPFIIAVTVISLVLVIK